MHGPVPHPQHPSQYPSHPSHSALVPAHLFANTPSASALQSDAVAIMETTHVPIARSAAGDGDGRWDGVRTTSRRCCLSLLPAGPIQQCSPLSLTLLAAPSQPRRTRMSCACGAAKLLIIWQRAASVAQVARSRAMAMSRSLTLHRMAIYSAICPPCRKGPFQVGPRGVPKKASNNFHSAHCPSLRCGNMFGLRPLLVLF